MLDNSENILDKFTNNFKKVLIAAQNLAFGKKRSAIEPEDLLLALIKTKGSLGSNILIKQKIDINFINDGNFYDAYQTMAINPENLPQPSEESQKIIEKAVVTAYKFRHKYIGTEHLLWGISQSDNQKTLRLLSDAKINVSGLKQHLNLILKSTSKFNELAAEEETKEIENVFEQNPEESTLGNFTIDLTDSEVQKDIDPVIGRKDEIDRLIEILSRRTKNNPVLLGDAGVGKTAIVEGLAKRINEGRVPAVLLNKKILNLDISGLVAGTMYRGEFENRLKQLINEIKNDSNTILFIDELHTIIGTGATAGSLDAANILKPALSRGQLHCIGATTFEEYKKHIESDKALERRFQPIIIHEPSLKDSLEILRGLRQNYEKFHNVKIDDRALEAAVHLSHRFLADKKLPDKAIDLIDEAAARLRVRQTKKNLTKKIKAINEQIAELARQKKQAILEENYLDALEYKGREETLLTNLARLKDLEEQGKQKNLGIIAAEDIKEIIAKMTGVPMSQVSADDNKKLINLEKKIAQNIFGQNQAIENVANTIRKSKTGLHNQNRPLASFMFLGPSGVGKTATAKEIAEHIFGGSHNMLRIDMSEFSERFNISKLIGSPAGYVGYKEGNKLTDVVKNKPYSLILFDEIEKAHPDVFNLLLPILEEGELTDATGRTVNFKNTIIVMTSNVGIQEFNQEAIMGFNIETEVRRENFQNLSDKILSSLKSHFPPEFSDRIDNIIIFEPLDKTAAKKIIKREIAELKNRLSDKNIELLVDSRVLSHLLASDQPTKEGARSLKRLVDTQLTNQIAASLLHRQGGRLEIKLEKNQIIIK